MTNSNQSGRSMIEMLGVLAIIGVLSVGGIAGYSKAMMKFRINKTIDQVSQIAQNIRILYARQKNYGSLSAKIVYKANLAPREMFEDGSGSYGMTNAFGGRVGFETASKRASQDSKAFVISLYDLPEEACIELATQDWGGGEASGLISVGIDTNSRPISTRENCAGESGSGYAIACAGGSDVPVPMPIDVAVDACSNITGSSMGRLTFKFY